MLHPLLIYIYHDIYTMRIRLHACLRIEIDYMTVQKVLWRAHRDSEMIRVDGRVKLAIALQRLRDGMHALL